MGLQAQSHSIGMVIGAHPGDAMESFYGQLLVTTPNGHSMEWPLGGGHHKGMAWKALWVAHGDTPNGVLWVAHGAPGQKPFHWNGHWGPSWGCHGKLLWVAHGDPTQWPFHGMAIGGHHRGMPWKASMGSSWGYTQWCSMGSSWGSRPKAIPLEWPLVPILGMAWKGSMGSSW